MGMYIIVAVDNNWGIGKDGDLLVKIPEDMKVFRKMTEGRTVIMGRKTLESFPNQKPLSNRTNIVITRNKDYKPNGEAIVVTSVEEAIKRAEALGKEIFVVGGGSIYKEMLPLCEEAYVTKVLTDFEADTYFPNLDNFNNWKVVEESEEKEYKGIKFKFTVYQNLNYPKD